jgi:hypothetical protein
VAIRGALFVDLALSGRLAGARMPRVIGESETGTRLADAVHRSVAGRAPTPWRRWYSHTGADVRAATEELISSGLWRSAERGRFADTNPELTAAQGERVRQFAAGLAVPADLDDAVVSLFATGAGLLGDKPRPRRQLLAMRDVVGPLLPTEPAEREVVQAAITATLKALRNRGRMPLSSR